MTAISPEQFGSRGKIRAGGKPGRVDPRGNSVSRRKRKEKMIKDPAHGGNGSTVPCVHCGTKLDFKSVEQDRKVPGGPYAYHNVQPSCKRCNQTRSNNPDWEGPLASAQKAAKERNGS